MSNTSSRPQWGELEQICTFPMLMKYWQHGAAYVIPGDLESHPPVLLRSGKDDSIKADAETVHADTAGSLSETTGEAASRINLAQSASTGATDYPSRLVNSKGRVFRNRMGSNYIVVSYTWGRWITKPRGNDTKLEGCDWKIPATTLFTRKQLDTAIHNIAAGQNVWLDVFCIPQDDDNPEKGVEIAKQGNIFKNASSAAVWLCSGGEEVLKDICSWIYDDFEHPALSLGPIATRLSPEDQRRLSVLCSLRENVPWTSSLWTLQESALRRDAVFYDRNGMMVINPRSNAPLRVSDLIKAFGQIATELDSALDFSTWMPEEDSGLFISAMFEVNGVALAHLDNLNANELLLGSKHRICERAHDRVYGIMGAGVSIPVDYSMNVDTLQEHFIVSLHNKYPAEMQSFIQVLPQTGRSSWKYSARGISLTEFRQDLDDQSNTIKFSGVTDDGGLICDAAMILSSNSLYDICSKLRSGSGTLSFDDLSLAYVEPTSAWPQQERTWQSDQEMSCGNVMFLSSHFQFLLIPLGRISKTRHMSSMFVYLLTRAPLGVMGSSQRLKVWRTGVLLLKERHDKDKVVGRSYAIY
jgi:hypothetical protein